MKRSVWFVLMFVLAGCGGDPSTSSPPAGGEGGPCYGNGTCDDGLSCLSDLCVDAGDPAPGEPEPDSDAGAPSDASGDLDDAAQPAPEDAALADVVDEDAGAADADDGGAESPSDVGAADAGDGGAEPPSDVVAADAVEEDDDGEPPAEIGFTEVVSREVFERMFLHNDNAACSGSLYTYDALVEAAARFPEFCGTGSLSDRRREAAAFLANISHETTGGWPTAPDGPQAWGLCFVEEVGCQLGGCTQYCDTTNVDYPCVPGQTYHGRGAMQLSWNYNYGQAGADLGLNLLENPDQVAESGTTAFLVGIWFWMKTQPPKPSCHDVMTGAWTPSEDDRLRGREPGFGMTINIINGGLECNQTTDARVEDRVLFYQRYAEMLGVDTGDNLYCDQMQSY